MLKSVAIVEDDQDFLAHIQNSLANIPEVSVEATAIDLLSGLQLLRGEPTDILLVDLGLPDGSGLDLITQASKIWPACSIVVITVFANEEAIVSAIRGGAVGYLHKGSAAEVLARELRIVCAGGAAISPSIAGSVISLLKQVPADRCVPGPAQDNAGLSPQETKVLQLAHKGYSYKEVAGLMGVKVATVHEYIKRIFQKLGVKSKSEAFYEARCRGVDLD